MKSPIVLLLLTTLCCHLSAQTDLSCSRIVIDTGIGVDSVAASVLQGFIAEISNKNIPIITTNQLKKGDIIIGNANKRDMKSLKKDGFAISSTDEFVRIMSKKGGNGSIYGVCEVLERYFGVRYWSERVRDVPKSEKMVLEANIDIVENPAFEFRQVNGYAQNDPIYKMFHRLDWAPEIFAGNLWVHTFNRLIPASVYGKEHPEYFASVRGERHSGEQSQLCLTNEDLFLTIAHKLDSIFKLDSTHNIISVSQNDGDYNNCTCDKCKAIDDREGSPSGSIIYFVNRLAERFPDKEISTLAYFYSVKPPKFLKPRPNVNIMLCNIECTRELALNQNSSGKEFMSSLEGWSRISNNIFIWDYGINFDNYISPFPNFHILKDNIELFSKNNVTKLFEQVNGQNGVDFSELRGYMLSKLMWNPNLDADKLMREFVWGYYGDAGKFIYDYLKLQQRELVDSNRPLLIYDSPISHANGFLSYELIAQYNTLFDKAEQAVANDSERLRRVRLSRLPLQYAELEVLRTSKRIDSKGLEAKLNLFKERSNGLNLKINEKGNTPDSYCSEFESRHLPSKVVNLAKGAEIEWAITPTKQYAQGAQERMTDGLYGGTSFVDSWIGWQGSHGEFTLDMGTKKEFTTITGDFLHQTNRWIFLPKSVEYLISDDNMTFTQFGTVTKPEERLTQTLFDTYSVVSEKPVKARYVKVKIETILKCPSWHYGFNSAAWCFIDELTVKR